MRQPFAFEFELAMALALAFESAFEFEFEFRSMVYVGLSKLALQAPQHSAHGIQSLKQRLTLFGGQVSEPLSQYHLCL